MMEVSKSLDALALKVISEPEDTKSGAERDASTARDEIFKVWNADTVAPSRNAVTVTW